MKGVNKCIFIGTLGGDPEVSYLQSGDAVAKFSIAVNKSWKDKQGNQQESTEWVRCVAFRKSGEIIGKYLTKGSKVYIEAEVKTSKYDKNGETRYSTEFVVNEFQFLDSRGEASPDSKQETGQSQNAQNVNNSFYGNSDIPF